MSNLDLKNISDDNLGALLRCPPYELEQWLESLVFSRQPTADQGYHLNGGLYQVRHVLTDGGAGIVRVTGAICGPTGRSPGGTAGPSAHGFLLSFRQVQNGSGSFYKFTLKGSGDGVGSTTAASRTVDSRWASAKLSDAGLAAGKMPHLEFYTETDGSFVLDIACFDSANAAANMTDNESDLFGTFGSILHPAVSWSSLVDANAPTDSTKAAGPAFDGA